MISEQLFDDIKEISLNFSRGEEKEGRDKVIKLLDSFPNGISYPPILNHIIRLSGLYPYIQSETAIWEDRYAKEVFQSNVGEEQPAILHREQSRLLKHLLDGEDIAVSAPTSFGKSFVIDAFIATKKPNNVVIIVPTIALTDETRRRLYKRFSNEYKIITTTDVTPSEKNIFVFPQERAIAYTNQLDKIDILIIDEFYKASPSFDSERSSSLVKALMKLGSKSKQRYYLAPNINSLNDNPFTEGMKFLKLDFNTVCLEVDNVYQRINGEDDKSTELLNILRSSEGKTLIYAGTYTQIDKVRNLIIENFDNVTSSIVEDFGSWLDNNYGLNWSLTSSIRRGTGIHNGRLHRSLSQIQVKLFEEPEGLKNIICTSSIIEGVNTSAQNVVIWKNKNGGRNLDFFTYKNISGRGGRMFQHFVGYVYVLETPPTGENVQLNLDYPDDLHPEINDEEATKILTEEQQGNVVEFKKSMDSMLGSGVYDSLLSSNSIQSSKSSIIKKIASDMTGDKSHQWNGFAFLNSTNFDRVKSLLFKVLSLTPREWGTTHTNFVKFIEVLQSNWELEIPELLEKLDDHDISINEFFKLERAVSFNLASLLSDVNTLYRKINPSNWVDISAFISRCSNAFLPKLVYQLEEYGLPRMISRKIHKAQLINFENEDITLHSVIDTMNAIGYEELVESIDDLDSFDKYILKHFFEGIN